MNAKNNNLPTRLGVITLYALIGGLSGLLESIILYVLGKNIPIQNLTLSFLINGLTFTIVGIGIIISLTLSIAELQGKVGKALGGGGVAGFVTGLFFHFGMGMYVGIIVLSSAIAFLAKLLGAKHSIRIFFGGILGGYGSIFLSIMFMSIQSDWLSIAFSSAIMIYFITFGMLASQE